MAVVPNLDTTPKVSMEGKEVFTSCFSSFLQEKPRRINK
jgi:hypothetical protein